MPTVARSLLAAGLLTLALAACGGQSTPTPNLAGDWVGTWTSEIVVGGGSVAATFVVNGGNMTGTVEIGNSPCLSEGTINGTVSGTDIFFGAVSGGDTVEFTAVQSGTTLSGTYDVTTGPCSADEGTFELEKVE